MIKNIAFPIAIGGVMEDFFKEGLAYNKKLIGLFYIHSWY